MKKQESKKQSSKKMTEEFPGYPHYPSKDDIYSRAEKASDVHPGEESDGEDDVRTNRWNEKGLDESYTGEDLDVPGSELDDDNEAIGEEDEENNYYSLGGDNHDDE